MKYSTVTAAASALLLGAGVALADAPAADGRIDFLALDTDRNGTLSMQEVRLVDDLAVVFDTLDANDDTQLSPLEFARWARAGNVQDALPSDPSTAPSGSAGAQHMPDPE